MTTVLLIILGLVVLGLMFKFIPADTDGVDAFGVISVMVNKGHGPALAALVYADFDLDAIDYRTVAELELSGLLPLSSSTKQMLNDRLSELD